MSVNYLFAPKVSAQAEFIRATLAMWAVPKGGTVTVMANMKHLWENIYLMDEKPRLLLCWTGDISRGGFNQANTLHRVDRQWMVIILRGHGWNNAVTVEGEQGEQPFSDCVEEVREIIRTMKDISEEFPVDYKTIRPLPNAGPTQNANVFMDGFAIEFSTANDLPAILWEAPTT